MINSLFQFRIKAQPDRLPYTRSRTTSAPGFSVINY
jgi:hypothetical protein